MAEVLLKNLGKTFPGGVVAVENFDLRVADKEFLVLVGPSGCGKSTVLRMIAGLEEPSQGDIFIGVRRCNEIEPKDRDIAMVFQSYALYPHMTVRENMEFGLKLSRRLTRKEIGIRVQEAAEILELQSLMDRKPKQLSGGQRQRVALGRAIVRKPSVFLFDEPLSNLDAKMRIQMRVEIGRLHARLQTTMIYVTHDQTEAMTMGDRIVCMKDGRIQQIASPLELYNKPANSYVAGFVGTPPMNFFDVELRSGQLGVCGSDCMLPLPPRLLGTAHIHGRMRLGVRPEHLRLISEQSGTLPALVEVVEPLGSETLVYTSTAAGNLVVRHSPIQAPEVGERVHVQLDEDGIHLFDAVSGQNLVLESNVQH